MSGPRVICWPRLGLARGETMAALEQVDGIDLAVVETLAEVVGTGAIGQQIALPPGAFVVNIALGAVLDQGALCDALHRGHLGGAALDFTDPEPPLRRLDDFVALGKQAVAEGWKAVKTNPIVFTPTGPVWCNSGFPKEGLDLAGNWNLATIEAVAEQMAALRQGLGPHAGLMLDLNFGTKPEGFVQMSSALEPYRLTWLEMGVHEPQALADVRRATTVPVASLEALYGRRSYRQLLDARAVDIAIVDVIWNGFSESVRIAELTESYEINVAPHNFYGHLANLISTHFAAAVPNFKITEYEVDDVARKADFVTVPPVIENGALVLPTTPGWGTEIDEEASATPSSGRCASA